MFADSMWGWHKHLAPFLQGEMSKKICIIGTHSAGKTTLSYMLAAHYMKLGKSVKIVQEVARSCPYPLNDGMTRNSCLWIYHEQMRKELEAMIKFKMVICDRSVIDSFMYAMAQNCFDKTKDLMFFSYETAKDWMYTYDRIVFVDPGSIKPVADGTRSTDIEFQKRVHDYFKIWAQYSASGLPITYLYAEQIFNNLDLGMFE